MELPTHLPAWTAVAREIMELVTLAAATGLLEAGNSDG